MKPHLENRKAEFLLVGDGGSGQERVPEGKCDFSTLLPNVWMRRVQASQLRLREPSEVSSATVTGDEVRSMNTAKITDC